MTSVDSLYQQIVLEHARAPRGRGRLDAPTHVSDGFNRLCGDRVRIELEVDGEVVRDVAFDGRSCAICTASTSLLRDAIVGRLRGEIASLADRFESALSVPDLADADRDALGSLAALMGVRSYPMRLKCATLPWHTLRAALEGRAEPVTTE